MILEEPILTQAVKEYTEFEVAGKRVQIPYYLARDQQWRVWSSSSKGTPKQIHQELEQKAKKARFDLEKATPEEIHQFMKDMQVGVDCSGFVYHTLDPLVKEKTGKGLGTSIKRYKGLKGELERYLFLYRRARRIGTKELTKRLNSIVIRRIEDLQPGDLIRRVERQRRPSGLRPRHVMVVIKVEKEDNGELKAITYAHSSRETRTHGPHLARIEVTNPHDWLDKQTWLETTKGGKDYGKVFFLPKYRSGVRRLRCLATI